MDIEILETQFVRCDEFAPQIARAVAAFGRPEYVDVLDSIAAFIIGTMPEADNLGWDEIVEALDRAVLFLELEASPRGAPLAKAISICPRNPCEPLF